MNLRNFIERMASIEDKEHLYRPEYLRLRSDEDELAEMCERRGCEKCTHPEDYCWYVLSELADKAAVYSAANRILEALETRGSSVLCGISDCESDATSTDILDSEYGEKFCEHCREYGTAKCPEDVYDLRCARRTTVRAVESVLSAVAELV